MGTVLLGYENPKPLPVPEHTRDHIVTVLPVPVSRLTSSCACFWAWHLIGERKWVKRTHFAPISPAKVCPIWFRSISTNHAKLFYLTQQGGNALLVLTWQSHRGDDLPPTTTHPSPIPKVSVPARFWDFLESLASLVNHFPTTSKTAICDSFASAKWEWPFTPFYLFLHPFFALYKAIRQKKVKKSNAKVPQSFPYFPYYK